MILNAECNKTKYDAMNAMDEVNKGRRLNHVLPRKGMDTKLTTPNTKKVLTPSILASAQHGYLYKTESCFNKGKV